MPKSINIFGLGFLNRPDAHYGLFLLSLVLLLPSLFVGFFADDFSHYVLIQQKPDLAQPDNLSLLHLFSFITTDAERSEALMAHSLIPWWTDPEFSMVFFRPLAELASFIDYALWPQSPILMHLHSLLWWLAIMVLSWQVFSKLLDRRLALLALLFVAVDAAHGFTAAWLANRNALMAQTFSLLALLFFMQFDQRRQYLYLVYSTLAVAASLLSAEAGMTVGVLLAAYVLFYSKQSLLLRMLSLLPSLVVFITWLAVYQAYDYGASGNHLYYVDPISSPVGYFQELPERLLTAVGMLFNPLPLYAVQSWHIASLVIATLLVMLLGFYCIKRHQPHLYFAAFIIVLSIVPAACTNMQERNLIYAAWAAAIILADILLFLTARQSVAARLISACVLIGHLWLSAVFLLGMSYAPKLLAHSALQQSKALNVKAGEQVVLLGVPLLQASFITPIRYYLELPAMAGLVNLVTVQQFDWQQISTNQWLVSSPDGLLSADDSLVRNFEHTSFDVGQSVKVGGLSIEVVSLNAKKYPTALKVTQLQSQPIKWLAYDAKSQAFTDLTALEHFAQ